MPIDDLDWDNADDIAQIQNYFSQLITAYNPDPFRPRGEQDCLLKDYLTDSSRESWNLVDDHCDLCNRCQKHGTISQGQRSCNPSQCHKNGTCRFHFPYPVTTHPVAFVDTGNGAPRKKFAALRNDPWLNQHSKAILLSWRANVDLQPVLDRKAAMKYVSKYASKPESVSQSYHDALSDFCMRLPLDLPAENAVQRLFARMAADRDISAQEAVHLLLGDKLVGCSRTFVNLNANIDAPMLLRELSELDEDDAVFEDNFFSNYEKRPNGQSLLNATQFCKMFTVKKGALSFCPSYWYLFC